MAPHDDHNHEHGHDHDHDHHQPRARRTASPYRMRAARVYCGDLDGAIAFYRDLMALPLLHQGPGFAVFDTGDTQLTLEHIAHGNPAYQDMVGRFTGLSFAVADLGVIYAHLVRQGVTFLAPPQPQAGGGGAAHFRDPAGNILTLVGRLGT